jgi:type IV pilus assembly protein PilA
MRGWLIVALVCAFAAPVYAQSGPEVEALLDAFFAKDLKSLSEHLPPELAEAINDVPADARGEVADRYLMAEQARRQGTNFSRPENGAVVRMELPHRDSPSGSVDVYLEKRMYDGNEVMLRFRPQVADSGPRWMENRLLVVWMKYVENNWRVYEIDMDGREIHLDDPDRLAYLKRPQSSANEASAVGTMRTINTAAITYSSTFPDVGFPESLENLGGSPGDDANDSSDQEANPDHTGLIDNILSTPPFQKSGYRFAYNKISGSEYSVSARPVKYGSDGTKSFFTDESGVIRATSEDRDATVDDPPLQ